MSNSAQKSAKSTVDDSKVETPDNRISSPSKNSTSSTSSTRNEDRGAASAGSIPTPPARSRVKHFFLKISEKMGGVEQTQYSEGFVAMCKDTDDYKMALEDLVMNLIVVAQRHPRYEPTSQNIHKMLFEYDENVNPYEMVYVALKEYNEFLPASGKADIKKYQEMVKKMAPLHRSFHRRARRCLKNIRRFLSVDYYTFCEDKRVLNERRQEMDFAKHELKNAKAPEVVEMKNLVYENAQKRFEAQLQKLLQLLDSFPKMKDVHFQDIMTFQQIIRVYHDHVAKC